MGNSQKIKYLGILCYYSQKLVLLFLIYYELYYKNENAFFNRDIHGEVTYDFRVFLNFCILDPKSRLQNWVTL
jgi:hypothetical protein